MKKLVNHNVAPLVNAALRELIQQGMDGGYCEQCMHTQLAKVAVTNYLFQAFDGDDPKDMSVMFMADGAAVLVAEIMETLAEGGLEQGVVLKSGATQH